MKNPDAQSPGDGEVKTGDTLKEFQVSPVSHLWLDRLVEIDSHWNPKSWSSQLFEKELSSLTSSVRGLFCQGDLVGYLIAHIVCDEAHIVSLGLAPEWRGQGGGTVLLADFLRNARAQGVCSISLDVRVSNLKARALYERHGFQVVGLRRGYYSDNGEDALTMKVELPSPPAGGRSSRAQEG